MDKDQDAAGLAPARRDVASRNTAWARRIATLLVSTGASPNQISVASVAFAAIGAAALAYGSWQWSYALCALMIQARLLCNLFDGMVAIEGGKKSAVGGLYNEVPDRVADSLLLAAWGVAAGSPALGMACALMAALTAYCRALGGALGVTQSFLGPMAKQHRMALMTVGLALGAAQHLGWLDALQAVVPALTSDGFAMRACLWIATLGSVETCRRRLARAASDLRQAEVQPALARIDSKEVSHG